MKEPKYKSLSLLFYFLAVVFVLGTPYLFVNKEIQISTATISRIHPIDNPSSYLEELLYINEGSQFNIGWFRQAELPSGLSLPVSFSSSDVLVENNGYVSFNSTLNQLPSSLQPSKNFNSFNRDRGIIFIDGSEEVSPMDNHDNEVAKKFALGAATTNLGRIVVQQTKACMPAAWASQASSALELSNAVQNNSHLIFIISNNFGCADILTDETQRVWWIKASAVDTWIRSHTNISFAEEIITKRIDFSSPTPLPTRSKNHLALRNKSKAVFSFKAFKRQARKARNERSKAASSRVTSRSLPAPNPKTDVVAYANFCKKELGMPDKLPVKALNCLDGTPAAIKWEGNAINGVNWLYIQQDQCDRKQWLDDSCHNYMFTQKVNLGGNVEAILNCRQKIYASWRTIAQRKQRYNNTSDKDKEDKLLEFQILYAFDDVAMIWTNRTTGKTCWFNSDLDEFQYSGYVPMPDTTSVPTLDDLPNPKPSKSIEKEIWKIPANKYWMTPVRTANHDCINCHDTGSWTSSPLIAETGLIPRTPHDRPYLNIGEAFVNWPRIKAIYTDDIPHIERKKLLSRNKQICTTCHRIGSHASDYDWVPQSTGEPLDPYTELGGTPFYRYWMPPPGNHDEIAWIDSYREHLNALSCCQKDPEALGCGHKIISQSPVSELISGKGHGNPPTKSCLPPLIEKVIPNSGSLKGGTPIRVKGDYFIEGTRVYIDDRPCDLPFVIDRNEIACLTPPNDKEEWVDVEVENDKGVTMLEDGYHYIDPTPTRTPTQTSTPTSTRTMTPTRTITPTVTSTPMSSPTRTRTPSPTPTSSTNNPTSTPTRTPISTITGYYWGTITPTSTPLRTPTIRWL